MSETAERRIARRARVVVPARAVWDEGSQACVIRDVSATGAKIGISRRVTLPPEFVLVSLQTDKRRRVQVKWRRLDHMGLSFIER